MGGRKKENEKKKKRLYGSFWIFKLRSERPGSDRPRSRNLITGESVILLLALLHLVSHSKLSMDRKPTVSRPIGKSQGMPYRQPTQPRSFRVIEEREKEYMRRMAGHFWDCAQVIKLPFTLQSLTEKKVNKRELEAECERLQSQDAQVMSAIFKDCNGEVILAYCASRPKGPKPASSN